MKNVKGHEGQKFSLGSGFLPHISLDCVIFGFHGRNLKILLLKMKTIDKWALPGGFVYEDEHLDDAVNRVLRERTGLEKIYLQQFYVFGRPDRLNLEYKNQIMAVNGLSEQDKTRISQRHITVGFYVLVDYAHVKPRADIFSEDCTWHDTKQVPQLILDHSEILNRATETLRTQLNYQPIGYNLLPEKFTMTELQTLYEVLLDKKLDRRNFQRRILTYGILNKLNEKRKGVAHKSPFLYSFNKERYQNALREGLQGGW